jgi:hypothetical protein
MQQPLKFEDVNNKMGQGMRGIVNIVVGILGDLFYLDYGVESSLG